MAQRLPILFNKKPCYDIVFSQSFEDLWFDLAELGIENRRVMIITDSNVRSLYAEELLEGLEGKCLKACMFSFEAGEASKTLDTAKEAYKKLIEEGFDRKDLLLAVGGGVVGDLTGYVAATYLRGVDFVQIPTTLLAQADSSIGGKTGVDFDGYKNMVGAFKMPVIVYVNLSTLMTLSGREYFNGFAEVMKHGLIKDASFYEWLITNMYEICERDLEVVEEMIMQSCTIKKLVVEKDPFEEGDRKLLNFGHTIGHAIEKAKGFELLHGECVALGCVAAAHISYQKQLITLDEYLEVRDMFVPFYLPITIEDIDPEEVLEITKSDKKMQAGKMNFVLLKRIGKSMVDTTVKEEEVKAAIREIHFSEEDMKE